MPPCILLIASRPALRERDIGTASMGEAGKIEPVLEARKLDRTVCLRAFSILSPEMYPKACSRQNEKIKLHRPSLFSLRSGSAKEAENADGMTSENASHKNSGALENLSSFLLPPYACTGWIGRNVFFRWKTGHTPSEFTQRNRQLAAGAKALSRYTNDRRFLYLPDIQSAAESWLPDMIGQYQKSKEAWNELTERWFGR